MKKLLLATAAVLAIAPAAHAQDKSSSSYERQTTTSTSTVTQPVYSNNTASTATTYSDGVDDPLTGLYLGAYGGYSWIDADTDVAGADFEMDGADYGLFVGFKVDQWLQQSMGMTGAIEAFYGWSEADDDVAGATIEKDHEWGINFRPGLSFLSMGTALNPYGIIGYRQTNFDASFAGLSDDEDFNGMDVGVGTELIAWGDIGMRIDYTHTFYEEKGGIDPDEDNVRVGLSYHF